MQLPYEQRLLVRIARILFGRVRAKLFVRLLVERVLQLAALLFFARALLLGGALFGSVTAFVLALFAGDAFGVGTLAQLFGAILFEDIMDVLNMVNSRIGTSS